MFGNEKNYNAEYTSTNGSDMGVVDYQQFEKKMYLSGDFNYQGMKVYIKEVIYSDPATIVIWNDGTKTVCKCVEGDIYSKESGLAICIIKKLVGGVKVHDVFADWVDEDLDRVTIKDVRRKLK